MSQFLTTGGVDPRRFGTFMAAGSYPDGSTMPDALLLCTADNAYAYERALVAASTIGLSYEVDEACELLGLRFFFARFRVSSPSGSLLVLVVDGSYVPQVLHTLARAAAAALDRPTVKASRLVLPN